MKEWIHPAIKPVVYISSSAVMEWGIFSFHTIISNWLLEYDNEVIVIAPLHLNSLKVTRLQSNRASL